MRTYLALLAIAGAVVAGCGDDGGSEVSQSATTVAAAASTATTRAGGSLRTTTTKVPLQCLTPAEVTALGVQAPEKIEPMYGTTCRYMWFATKVRADISVENRQNAKAYYDKQLEYSKDEKYREQLPSPGIGQESWMIKSTGVRGKPGYNGIIRAWQGDFYVGSNYVDYDNQLNPSLDANIKFFIALVKAQLAKAA